MSVGNGMLCQSVEDASREMSDDWLRRQGEADVVSAQVGDLQGTE